MKSAVIALIANTAPVAFGALATPIITLAAVTSGVSQAPGLTVDNLGAMAGRQTPILAAVVPLVLVYVVDGKRGLRQTWLPALVAGVTFGIAQFITANYISVPLTDIVASLVAAACGRRPAARLAAGRDHRGRSRASRGRGPARRHRGRRGGTTDGTDGVDGARTAPPSPSRPATTDQVGARTPAATSPRRTPRT